MISPMPPQRLSLSSSLVCLTAATLFAGCGAPNSTQREHVIRSTPDSPGDALNRLLAAPEWPTLQVDAAFASWVSEAPNPPAPASVRQGMLALDDVDLERPRGGFHSRPIPQGAPRGAPVSVHHRLFRRAPWALVQPNGQVEVHFETVRPVAGAGLYYGTVVPADPFRAHRYRRHSTELARLSETRYMLSGDIRPLLRERYDVGQTVGTGIGTFAFRVELLDPEGGEARVFDGLAGFRCVNTDCAGENTFRQTPSFELGPFVDVVTTESATISAQTDVPSRVALALVSPQGALRVVQAPEASATPEIPLVDLQADTRYGYQLWAMDTNGETRRSRVAAFTTAPEGQASFTFSACSDSRSGHGTADDRYAGTNRRVLERLMLESMRNGASFNVFVGDLIDGYTTSPSAFRFELFAWRQAMSMFSPYFPIYELMGNHESLINKWEPGWALARPGPDSPEQIFADSFVNPTNAPEPARPAAPTYSENTYSFDYGHAHFSAINSNYWYRSHPGRSDHPDHGQGQHEGWLDDTTLAWLDADLTAARARGQRHLFVFTHEPGFPNGGHSHDGMYYRGEIPEVLARRDAFFQLIARHGVVALVHGDEHNYSRLQVDESLVPGMTRPVWQLVSGGAGAPYYAQEQGLPWSDQVAAFDPRQHVLLFDVHSNRVGLRVVGINGETIDEAELTRGTSP